MWGERIDTYARLRVGVFQRREPVPGHNAEINHLRAPLDGDDRFAGDPDA